MLTPVTNFHSDPAHDILRSDRHPLSSFFSPASVAVIGASDRPGSVGRTLLRNLIENTFGGTVFPINPQHRNVMGIEAYPNIAEVGEPIELAVIATPASTVPDIVRQCVEVGVKSAVILSAGFKEIGTKGIELERQILEQARQGNLRIIGPNCLGFMNPHTGINATFASGMAKPGNVGFISQSGALCTAVLDWSFRENVGFSAFISLGSMLDVGWGDLIYYLGDDPNTKSIAIYMESIGNARAFLSAAREVALTKPIIVIKPGKTEAAAKASASHTGSMTGSDEVLDAAFRRCGVLRVTRISELFNMTEVLAKQPRPKGPRLTIITNAGGPGVLATDLLVTTGGELTELDRETLGDLDRVLPTYWSHGNPIDILGDATPERYAQALTIAAKDPGSDGLLVILTPQAMTDPTETAEQLVSAVKTGNIAVDKPILASWMGGEEVMEGEAILNRASIPTYAYPDSAAAVFNDMWRYSYNLRGIYETPFLPDDGEIVPDRALCENLIAAARQAKRTILTEFESKQILQAYGIEIVKTFVATSPEEAVKFADSLGYPVAVKLFSHTITHKTDVGGVQLNLKDDRAVLWAYDTIKSSVEEKVGAEHFLGVTVQSMLQNNGGYELIIGSSLDPQFGPVLLFGSGGQLVEVFKDRSIALPPLNTTLARRMMEQTQIYKALKGVRGRKSVNLAALEELMVRFSQLVVEQHWIKEIDINPLLVWPEDNLDRHSFAVALDARIVLHEANIDLSEIPKLAIRPYPIQYVSPWTLKDGTEITIRPIRPEDEPLAAQFHQNLSEQSVYLRYFHLMKLSHRIAHERLIRLCFIDYDRDMALVAEYQNPLTNKSEIVAIARLSKLHNFGEAEFAAIVSDPFQRRGLGTELLRRLVRIGLDEGLQYITAEILAENGAMQRVCQKVGFHLDRTKEPSIVKATLDLSS